MVNFHYAINLAQMLYDVEGNLEDLEEIGLIAYNFIGNKNTRLYRTVEPIGKDGVIELPCNCDIIESVTMTDGEDWNYTSNTKEFGEPLTKNIENNIESQKLEVDPFYLEGRFVNYRKVGNKLYTNKTLGKVNILYHGILLDDDGLPELTEKEAVAISEYIAYTLKYKDAIKTGNQNSFTIALDLKQSWLFHCDAARVPEYVSQGDMDKILDAQASWGRKTYKKSYKPFI